MAVEGNGCGDTKEGKGKNHLAWARVVKPTHVGPRIGGRRSDGGFFFVCFRPIDSVVCVHLFDALHVSVALRLSVIMVLPDDLCTAETVPDVSHFIDGVSFCVVCMSLAFAAVHGGSVVVPTQLRTVFLAYRL